MFQRDKLLLICLLCSLMGSVYAEKGDREQPMNIEADNASLDQRAQLSIFTGNVVIVQGSMQLLANKVTVREDANGYQYSEGSGSPVRFRQKMDNSPDYLEAQALKFDYNGKTGILKLYDQAWVKRAGNEVKGSSITYDMTQETYEAQTQKENGGRVNVTIVPKKKEPVESKKNSRQAAKPFAIKKLPEASIEHAIEHQ